MPIVRSCPRPDKLLESLGPLHQEQRVLFFFSFLLFAGPAMPTQQGGQRAPAVQARRHDDQPELRCRPQTVAL